MRLGPSAAVVLVLVGCGTRTGLPAPDEPLEPCGDAGATRPCETICGAGLESCVDGFWRDCTAPKPRPPSLAGTIRDFRDTHPDFEAAVLGNDLGIVEQELGPDDKPVYASTTTTPTTSGRAGFDQWYRDVPGVNAPTAFAVELRASGAQKGLFVFDDDTFFPIDGELFGNEGREHNFHFTFETTARFRYLGGERFTFEGDDDVWVFVNRRLAVDLGGVHATERGTVALDDRASDLGIEPNGVYPLHFFFAERHTSGSTFRIETTIAEFDLCD